MLISAFETELYTQLKEFFSERGFILLPERKQFRKTIETGFQNVIFSSTTYENEVWLEVNFGVRHDRIEQIAQQFLGYPVEYRADANTTIISIGKFNQVKYFRYKIMSTDDLHEACFQIKDFFVQTGFAFLDDTSGLKALDKLLNTEPTRPNRYLYNQVHRAFKGLVAARFTNSDRFAGLSELYRVHLAKNGTPLPELQAYERLLGFLLYHSVN